ncbi:MAG: CinA family protein [Chloroflexota bacterium]|nr:CinA family protein [Chloroflexota bacterium]
MESFQLANRIADFLHREGLSLALAESCTGGLVGDHITDVPGSSEVFLGGAIVYSNQAKMTLLGVHAATLDARGAVSPECAAEMALGARRLFETDLAVSVTGIAGPGGGTEDKPLGLTFLHLSAPDAEIGRKAVWKGNRRANKLSSAREALQLLLDYLEARQNDEPNR